MFSDRGSGRSKLEIKLIDFGLSMKYGKSMGKFDMTTEMTDFVGKISLWEWQTFLLMPFGLLIFTCCLYVSGTIYTMAPEVIRGSYT